MTLVDRPLIQYAIDEARAAGIYLPDAMALATADAAGVPNCRMVVLRGIESGGLQFFTDYSSVKGRELAARRRVLGRDHRVDEPHGGLSHFRVPQNSLVPEAFGDDQLRRFGGDEDPGRRAVPGL